MAEKIEYVIGDRGEFMRRRVIEGVVPITDAMLAQISVTQPRRVRGIYNLPAHGVINGAFQDAWNWWTVPMPKLTIRAPFRMQGDALVPVFNSSTDPVMTMEWVPNFRLSMLISERQQNHTRGNAYLIAGDTANPWRLPLANIFEDCKICMGEQPNPSHTNSVDCILTTIRYFNEAHYNADLWSGTDATFAMFRFKPQNEGFQQQPTPGGVHWSSLCSKCVGDAITYLFL